MSPERKARISPTVIVLGFVSLLTDMSTESVYPLIPLFLKNVLKAHVPDIGIIEGIAESTASITRVFAGWLSDKLQGRKWITVAGYSLSALSKPLLYFATVWPQVLGIRFADRLGKGIRSAPRDALIADVSDPANRGIAFGFHNAMDTIGAILGPLLAFLVIRSLAASGSDIAESLYRRMFLLTAIPAAIGILILVLFVREHRHTADGTQMPPVKLSGLGKDFVRFLIVTVVFSLGNSSDVFLVLKAQRVGISTVNILLVYALFNTVEATFSTWAGAVSDRIGRKNVILVGYVIFAFVYAGFGLAANWLTVVLLFAAYGLYNAVTQGAQKAFAADLTESNVRGTGMGTYQTLSGLALFPASVIAGYLWTVNPSATFYYGAATAIIAALMLAVLFRSRTTYSGM